MATSLPPGGTGFVPTDVTPEFEAALRASGMYDANADRLELEGYDSSDGVHVKGRMEDVPGGTYIWRKSRQDGCVALSSKRTTGQIVHVLYPLHRDALSGAIQICVDREPTSKRFASIQEVIAEYKQLYRHNLLELERVHTTAAPILPNDTDKTVALRTTILSSPFYDITASAETAAERLRPRLPGTYIFRPSETVPEDFAVSWVRWDRDVRHSRLTILPSGYILYDGHRYANLIEFFESKEHSGVLKFNLLALEAAERHGRGTQAVSSSPAPSAPARTAVNEPGVAERARASSSAVVPPPVASPQPEKESAVCVVCLDRQIDAVILECGHVCSCLPCTERLTQCPMCRGTITRVVRIYATWQ